MNLYQLQTSFDDEAAAHRVRALRVSASPREPIAFTLIAIPIALALAAALLGLMVR